MDTQDWEVLKIRDLIAPWSLCYLYRMTIWRQSEQQYCVILSSDDSQITASSDKILSLIQA